MTRAYTTIAFTPEVKQAQILWGTRESCALAETTSIEADDRLTEPVKAFIEQANTAVISTVASNGWPYAQHRGGAKGFMRALDDKHLIFPDYEGNGQLITIGNLTYDDRMMLLLINYAERRRLKLWGGAKVLLTNQLEKTIGAVAYAMCADTDAQRWLLFETKAFNFNCSAYVPQLFAFE